MLKLWFHDNYMVANPYKFQSICLGAVGYPNGPHSVQNSNLYPTNEIKVLT